MAHYLADLQSKHAITAAVAVAAFALALADGGATPVASSIAAAVSWTFVLVGVAAGPLPRARPARPAIVVGIALAALAALTGLSAIWAADPGSAFAESVVALAYCGLFVLIVLSSARGEARAWLAGLAIALAGVCVFALGARLSPALFGDGERELIEALPAAEGRLADPFPYWNALAAALGSGLVLTAWFAAGARGRTGRALGAALIPAFALALYMTSSRGGIAAALIGLVVLLALGPSRLRLAATLAVGLVPAGALIAFASTRTELLDHPLTEAARDEAPQLAAALAAAVALAAVAAYLLAPSIASMRPRRVHITRARAIALSVAALALIAAAVLAVDPAERWQEFKDAPESPIAGDARALFDRGGSSGRYQFWSAALDAFEAEPLKGVGAAGYEYWWNANGSLSVPGPNGHSLLFDNAAELGLLGLAAVLGFAVAALFAGVARVRERSSDAGASSAALAVLAAGLALAAIDWTWELPGAFLPVVLAAAVLAGPAAASPGRDPAPAAGERSGRRRFVAGLGLLGFAWIAVCAAALLLLTSVSLSSSRAAFEDGELASAASSAEDAIDLQPWSAQPRQQLALVLEAEGDYARARGEIEAAIRRSPDDWRLQLVAARIALRAGDEELARADAERAKRLAPRLEPLARPVDEILDGLL